jgi:PAS domain S-box-containing protein
LLPVVTLIGLIFSILVFDFSTAFVVNPPYLLLTLNLIFWTIGTLAIAFISLKSYLKDGSLTILLLSSSIIIFGLSVIISGWVGTFSGPLSVAISNPCLLVASVLQVLSSVLSFRERSEIRISNRKKLLTIAYISPIIFVVINTIFILLGYYPNFFTAAGPTLLRQVVLGTTVILFLLASAIFGFQYFKTKSVSIFWISLAIALLGIGLFSAFEVKTLGDVPTWLGRATLYIGTVYLIAAILASRQKSGSENDLASAWAESFRTSREQSAALFKNMLDAFIYCKIEVNEQGKPTNWIYLDTNEAHERMVGLKREQIINKKVSDLHPDESKDPVDWIGRYGYVALTGEPLHFEGYRQSLKRWLHVSAYSPKKGYFVSIFEDITERKQAEEQLKKAKEQYALLFNSVNEGFAHYKASYGDNGRLNDLLVLEINPAGAKYSGVKREKQIGKTWREIWLGIDDTVFDYYRKVDQTKEPFTFEHSSSLTNRWYTISIYKITQDQFAATFTDITERKELQQKIEGYTKNLEKLIEDRTKKLELTSLYARNLIEASLDPLVTINVEGKITDVNKATEQATGCTREELIGSDFSNYFTEPQKAENGYKQVFTKGFVRDYPLAIKHKSGKISDVSYNAAVYRTGDGKIQGVFAAARDITELKKAEEEAKESTKKLKDAERLAAIGATAGMVGHDIRNPLQAITSDVYLAKTELNTLPDSEGKKNALESMEEIEKNTDYINKIVQDLQDYARPLNPKAEETDVQQIIEKIIAKNSLPKTIKVSVKVADDARKIGTDSYYINRIMYNLVTNSIQAMPSGGKLTIQAYREENDVVINVKDTGVGIPKEIQSKMFTAMFTTKSKGQGFGLPVVKRMAESLGGTVTFESSEGKGTIFTVRLPSQRVGR